METQTAEIASRRNFLKKVAYTAPAIIALGTLTAPMSANASVIQMGQVTSQQNITYNFSRDTVSGDVTLNPLSTTSAQPITFSQAVWNSILSFFR
ncbi:hypothetical protein [Sulfuricurvum sp.]|uniref:hypothetical protein n=1 Tax=Sulfuricurvum sp. TaxID=2025608 RepID=UPI002621DBF3|nr:hypothetical protein [Sulfuricurvum sp.]MDD2781642.1 hypothetical protein [Sulfuricurvum sp.]